MKRNLAVLSMAVSLLGCANLPRPTGPVGPMITPQQVADSQNRCRVGSGQPEPLVTEWPASEKANLEALIKRGGVAVAYSGCSMKLLTNCALGGGYGWQRTSPASEA